MPIIPLIEKGFNWGIRLTKGGGYGTFICSILIDLYGGKEYMSRTPRPPKYKGKIRAFRVAYLNGKSKKFTLDEAFERFGQSHFDGNRSMLGDFLAFAVQVGHADLKDGDYTLIHPNQIKRLTPEQQRQRQVAVQEERAVEAARLAQTITVGESEEWAREELRVLRVGLERRHGQEICARDAVIAELTRGLDRLRGAGAKYVTQGNLQGATSDAQFRIAVVRSLARSARNHWIRFSTWLPELLRDMHWVPGQFTNHAIGRVLHLIATMKGSELIEHRKGNDGAQFKLGSEGCAIVDLGSVDKGRALLVEDIGSVLAQRNLRIAELEVALARAQRTICNQELTIGVLEGELEAYQATEPPF